MSKIHFTSDGDTMWLKCFTDDPDAEDGQIIDPVDVGDSWDAFAAKVREHQAAHGCGDPGAVTAEARALAGHLDLATRLMLDLGGDQLAASARRIRKAAGLEG